MALESATYISDLVSTNPTSSDNLSQGDDHLRLLKSTVKATFPNVTGAVLPTHTELNFVDGVTSSIQTQLDAKASKASANTFTAAQTINGASLLLNANSDYEPQTQLTHAGATAGSGAYSILNRARGTYGSPTIVASGDQLGNVLFQGYDGTAYRSAASIEAQVDGTPGANDMPGRLTFKTTPDGGTAATERMRIDSSGNVGIGAAAANGKLDVNGGNVYNTTTATGTTGYATYNGTNVGTSYSYDFNASNAYQDFRTRLIWRDIAAGYATRMQIDASGNLTVGGNPVISASGTAAQGDVLYHNGTAWTRLAAGTSGQVLKTNGAGANPSWANETVAGWVKLAENTSLTSGTSWAPTVSLSGYKVIVIQYSNVSTTQTGGSTLQLNGAQIAAATSTPAGAVTGMLWVELLQGYAYAGTRSSVNQANTSIGVTTATTTLSFAWAAGSFDAGSITVYGIA